MEIRGLLSPSQSGGTEYQVGPYGISMLISCRLLKGVPQVDQARAPGLVRIRGLVSSHQPASWSGAFSAGLRLHSCRQGP